MTSLLCADHVNYICIQEEQTSATALASKMVETMKFLPTQVLLYNFFVLIFSGGRVFFFPLLIYYISLNWFLMHSFPHIGSILWRKWADPILCYLSEFYCFQGGHSNFILLSIGLSSLIVHDILWDINQGGLSEGYKNYVAEKEIPDDTYTEDGVALFRVQGSGPDNMQAIQVEKVCMFTHSLCNTCLIMTCPIEIHFWSGVGLGAWSFVMRWRPRRKPVNSKPQELNLNLWSILEK